MKVFKKQHPDSTKRRLGVIGRLEAQLKAGLKPTKGDTTGVTAVVLTDVDKVRINKELTILKQRT